MNIKKVDDKPMVIHTKEKTKIHSHVSKGASIKGSNIYTVNRDPRAKGSVDENHIQNKSYRKSTVHKGKLDNGVLSRFTRGMKDSKESIKMKQMTLRNAGAIGAKTATDQVEGVREFQQASALMYETSRPAIGITSGGAALFRRQAMEVRRKKIKQVQASKKIAKRTVKDVSKKVAKESAKELAKDTAKATVKATATVAASATGTAVAPGVGTMVGYVAGKAVEVKMDYADMINSNRARKLKFFIDKMNAQENQKDSFAKLVKDLVVRRASMVIKQVLSIAIPSLLLSLFTITMTCIPVISSIAVLYNSPFALFLPSLEAGDAVSSITSSYILEFKREVNELANDHTDHDRGEIVYVDYEGTDANPSNYYDIMCVYMVKHGIGDTATIMNDKSKKWLEEVVEDMCSYTTSSRSETYEDEDGKEVTETIFSVNVSLKSYRDMIAQYNFSDNEISLLTEMMNSEYLAILGQTGGATNGNSTESLMQAEIDTILNATSSSTQETVLNYALSKVGFPYSQELRDSGDYYDCSSLTYYSWKVAGVDISYGGATSAAAQAQGLEEAGKVIMQEELMPGDLIFYSYTNNGRYLNISHVGIYVGGGKMVEAKSEAEGVVYGSFHSKKAVLYARPNK